MAESVELEIWSGSVPFLVADLDHNCDFSFSLLLDQKSSKSLVLNTSWPDCFRFFGFNDLISIKRFIYDNKDYSVILDSRLKNVFVKSTGIIEIDDFVNSLFGNDPVKVGL